MWLRIRSLLIFPKFSTNVLTVKPFRSAYCDVSMPPEGLREFLPRLIPVYVFLIVQISAAVPWSWIQFLTLHMFSPRHCCRTWFMLMTMSHLLMLRCGNFLSSFMLDQSGSSVTIAYSDKYHIYFLFRKTNPFRTGTRLVMVFLSNFS